MSEAGLIDKTLFEKQKEQMTPKEITEDFKCPHCGENLTRWNSIAWQDLRWGFAEVQLGAEMGPWILVDPLDSSFCGIDLRCRMCHGRLLVPDGVNLLQKDDDFWKFTRPAD